MPPSQKSLPPYLPSDLLYVPNPNPKRLPYLHFRAVSSLQRPPKQRSRQIGKSNHTSTCTCAKCRSLARRVIAQRTCLYYRAGISLINATFEANGFTPTKGDGWNVLWATGGIKGFNFQGLNRFQKVNHFPRTFEITRKDQLCRNINRMQQLHGIKHFNFIPPSFVLPGESGSFRREAERCPGVFWIVKPAASACGRGIFVTGDAEEAMSNAQDGNMLVSRYIANPLLLDGRKFDIRVYVGVTSFNPLKVYVYRDGLARLSTEQYTSDPASFSNRFVHLTNYSVQKKSSKFQQADEGDCTAAEDCTESKCDGEGIPRSCDEEVSKCNEESRHKWSFSTLRRRLQKMGLDDVVMWEEMSTVIIKTLISIEPQVVAAMDMFVKHPTNCFQLFGFDILFDANLKPWLIEVNLGPSMACESSLDMDVKSNMIADLLTLSGVQPYDHVKIKECASQGVTLDFSTVSVDEDDCPEVRSSRDMCHKKNRQKSSGAGPRRQKSNSGSRTSVLSSEPTLRSNCGSGGTSTAPSTPEERRAIRILEEETQRCGGWGRIFPTAGGLSSLRGFFAEQRPLNTLLSQHLSLKEFGTSGSPTREVQRTRARNRRCSVKEKKQNIEQSKASRLDEDMRKHQQRQREALINRRAQQEVLRQATGFRD